MSVVSDRPSICKLMYSDDRADSCLAKIIYLSSAGREGCHRVTLQGKVLEHLRCPYAKFISGGACEEVWDDEVSVIE